MVKPALAERHCNIYFPSKEDKHRWEKVAEEKGVPLSRFVYETIEASLSEETDPKNYFWFYTQHCLLLKAIIQLLKSGLNAL